MGSSWGRPEEAAWQEAALHEQLEQRRLDDLGEHNHALAVTLHGEAAEKGTREARLSSAMAAHPAKV